MSVTVDPEGTHASPLRLSMSDIFLPPSVGWSVRSDSISDTTSADVALGELLIDFAPVQTDENGYPTLAAHPGGAPGNFLAALTKYGRSTAMIGKVGQDLFGRLLLETLRQAGIETRGVVCGGDVFTTLAFVSLDKSGNRDFSFAR